MIISSPQHPMKKLLIKPNNGSHHRIMKNGSPLDIELPHFPVAKISSKPPVSDKSLKGWSSNISYI